MLKLTKIFEGLKMNSEYPLNEFVIWFKKFLSKLDNDISISIPQNIPSNEALRATKSKALEVINAIKNYYKSEKGIKGYIWFVSMKNKSYQMSVDSLSKNQRYNLKKLIELKPEILKSISHINVGFKSNEDKSYGDHIKSFGRLD